MKITREEAGRIAALAHLELDDAALDRVAGEMTKILTYIDQLREAPAEDSSPAAALKSGPATPLREDLLRPTLDRDEVAANAPAWHDGFFVVPKVIGD